MALPGGRPITVDGKGYHWICKKERYPIHHGGDDGDDDETYDRVVTIVADEGGPVVQHRRREGAVTPQWVADMIRADVVRKQLGRRKRRK